MNNLSKQHYMESFSFFTKSHPFHIVNPSNWPIKLALSSIFLMLGLVNFFHRSSGFYTIIAVFFLLSNMLYKLQIVCYRKKTLNSIEEPLRQLSLIYSRSWNVSLNVESKILSKFRFLKKRKHFCVIRSPHIFKKIKVSSLFIYLIMALFNEKELKYYEK